MTSGTAPFSSSRNASTPEPASAQVKPSASSSRTKHAAQAGLIVDHETAHSENGGMDRQSTGRLPMGKRPFTFRP